MPCALLNDKRNMRNISRKTTVCLVALSFLVSNSAYSFNADTSTLRSKALTNNAQTREGMIKALSKLSDTIESADIKRSSAISHKSASSGLTQYELKNIYDAQESGNWRKVQDNQSGLKKAFLLGYEKTWQRVKKQYPGLKSVFDPQNPGRQRIIFTPEMARDFNITPRDKATKKPTGHFKEFYDKSDNSTAGVRDFYDPLHSENPDNMYNEAFIAILVQAEAEFLRDVHKELTAHLPNKGTKEFNNFIQKLRKDISAEDLVVIEQIYGMELEDIVAFLKQNIVKLVGGEVRAHSAKFIDMEARILAENGITVLTAEKYSDSVPIYMFSFLTYILGASGATNNTPSHSSNYIFGRKALAPDGSQLLPNVYEKYHKIVDDIIESRIYGVSQTPYEIILSSRYDDHIKNTLLYESIVKLYKTILNITSEEIALINKATKEGHRIVLNCLNGSTWKTLRVLLKELGINPKVFDLVMENEDPYFNVGYIVTKSDDGTYSVDHLGIDTTMKMVADTIPYASFLKGYAAGTRQYELDPDSDRFVLKQVLDKDVETMRLIEEYGIDYYELDNNKILIAPSPNKVFLNLDIADYERMVEAGTWEQFHSLYMITYVSSRAWIEFADAVDGLIRVMHRVGFKNLNDIQRVVQQWHDNKIPFDKIKEENDFIKEITYDAIIFYDQFEREIAIDRSKRIRIHSKQEERGGRVAGMNKPSYNLLGQSTLAMPEKSAADSLLSELIHSSRLFLENPENYSLLKFNDYAFKKFGLRSKIDVRLDILHGDQGVIAKMPFEDKKKALADALLNKNNFNNFFFSVASAVKYNNITKEKAIEIFTAVMPKYIDTWQALDEITLAEEKLSGGRTRPEGAPLVFKGKDNKIPMVTEFDFRPSGTDALKSKIYYDAKVAPDKKSIEDYFTALTGYNLYDVLRYYGIESVLEEPENISDIDLKTLVLREGPDTKSPSIGNGKLDLETKLAIETQFNNLLELRRGSGANDAIKQFSVKLQLPKRAFLSSEFTQMLGNLGNKVRIEFGENVTIDILSDAGGERGMQLDVLIELYSVLATPRSSSGGTIELLADKIAAVHRNIEEKGRLSRDETQDLAEGGFVFDYWEKNPATLASGKYADLISKSDKFTSNEAVIFNAQLKRVKKRLLKEKKFNKEDFDVMVEIVYPAYKAATYHRASNTIKLDRRCFKNDDFLYFKVEHELSDRKLPDMDVIGKRFKESPGLRELFTLITVDIAGFMQLSNSPLPEDRDRAERMLEYCRSVGDPVRGLLECYEKIMENTSLNDPFAFTEDIFRLVESEEHKTYFLNTREAVRRIASKNRDGSINYETTSTVLRAWLKSIYKQSLELQDIREISRFKPLTDFNKKTPVSLRPFMPYAKDIDYQLDNDCIFLRAKIYDKQGRIRFAYLYIGLNDDWNSVLGKRGKIYSLTYHKWQHTSAGIFEYKHIDTERERGLYWDYLIRLSATQLIKKLCHNSGQDKLKKLFSDLFNELGIKGDMGNRTWLSVKKIVGRKRGPSNYYVIRGIIWKHIDRNHPKLFLGEENLRDTSVGEIPAWLLMKDSEMGPKALSFLNPRKKCDCPNFYEEADRVSMRDILRMLDNTSFQSMRQMGLFDTDQVAPAAILNISNINNTQTVNSAIHIAA